MAERFKVVIPDADPEEERPDERKALDKIGAKIICLRCRTEEELMAATRDADAVLVTGSNVMTRRVIENLRRCKVIVRYGIGVDNIDLEAATERGIVVANVPDFCMEEVANHAIMFLLACAKKLAFLHNALRAGIWDRKLLPPMPCIYGQTLGLVGFGRIARAVARKAHAFNLRILAYDPYVDKSVAGEYGVVLLRGELGELLEEADYVSIHVPLTEETRHMFGEEEFRRMKPTAFLINTSRGAVVDERALIKALREGWIAGAALDVFEKEPPDPDNPLLKMDNVIVTPHSASYSDAAFRDLRRRVGEEAARVLSGRRPLHPVNLR